MNTAKTLELLQSEAAYTRMCELYGAEKAEENIIALNDGSTINNVHIMWKRSDLYLRRISAVMGNW